MHTFSFKNSGDVENTSAQYTRQTKKDAMTSGCLDRKEVRGAIWGVHSTGTGQPVETQDVFFWHLAGQSVPTGLAIVYWIGCINAIKYTFLNPCHWKSSNIWNKFASHVRN